MSALGEVPAWLPVFGDFGAGHDFEPLAIEGSLPAELAGVLYRNGAMGMIAADGERYEHWFDGDGGLLAVRIEGGEAQGAVRLLESPGLLEERRRNKRLHLGYGSTVDRPLLKLLANKMKNVANTNVIRLGDELMALVEASPPSKVDTETLKLLGADDLGGVIKGGFSAHPHTVVGNKRLINTGIEYGMKTTLRLYSVAPNGQAEVLYKETNPHAPLVHDFGLTERAAVLLLPPLEMKMKEVVQAGGAVSEGFVWDPKRGTEVLVVSLDEPDRPIRFTVDPFFQWHFGNAYQSGQEVVLDLVRYRDFQNSAAIGNVITGTPNAGEVHGQLCRMRIDLQKRTHTMEIVGRRTGEFPQTNPLHWGLEHRFVYLAEHSSADVAQLGMPDSLCRYDMQTGAESAMPVGEGVYPGEPLVVPKKAKTREDAVWILTMAYDSVKGRSGLLIHDGESLGAGPVASAWFSGPRHTTFHGHWQPA